MHHVTKHDCAGYSANLKKSRSVLVEDIEDEECGVGDDEKGSKGGEGCADHRLLHHDAPKLLIENLHGMAL